MKKILVVAALSVSGNTFAAENETKPFSMDGEFGLISTSGNSDNTSLKAKLSANQDLDHWSNDFLAEGLYTESDDSTTANQYYLSGQGNYKLLNPDYRIYVFSSYENDKFSSYNYQATISAGWNHKLWENELSRFEYSIGPGFSFSETDDGNMDSAILRGSLAFRWNVSDNATFKQALSTEIGKDNTKSSSETSVSAKVIEDLSLKLALTLDHNTHVDNSTEKLDSQVSASVVYAFL